MLARLPLYLRLVRMDKPIGSLLLLWPTLNALWIASGGHPSPMLLLIFVLGTLLMRSAGCAINLDLHMSPTPPALRDVALFSFWSVLAIGSWCPLPLSRSRFLADRSRTLVVKSQPQYL